MDIIKAIETEKQYLECRMKGEYPFHLVDKIRECGFETLDEYFAAKQTYEFGQLEFEYIEKAPSECIAEFFRMMDDKETGVVFIDSNETFVFSGGSKPYDEEYCETNNIPVYPLYTPGGAIVSTIGDFSIGITTPASVCSDVQFVLDGLKAIFDKYMSDVETNGNDILLNGNKICGSVGYHQNDMFCFAAHFSFNNNSELVNKICGNSGSVKPISKIEGLTVDMFKKELSAWLQVHSI